LKKNDFEYQKQLGVFFISGSTKSTVREKIREYLNSSESKNEILIAQSTTISTGINLPKLTNLVIAEMPGKSFTKILQSIGRVMRKSKEKGNTVFIWDIIDVFPYKNENYSLKHFWERMEYYNSEEHEIIEMEKELK
jgi:predicted helicase